MSQKLATVPVRCSARMDPEDLREVISAYQKCVTETVGRFGGFVAKFMGDGVRQIALPLCNIEPVSIHISRQPARGRKATGFKV